jgi:hypothetical protein
MKSTTPRGSPTIDIDDQMLVHLSYGEIVEIELGDATTPSITMTFD